MEKDEDDVAADSFLSFFFFLKIPRLIRQVQAVSVGLVFSLEDIFVKQNETLGIKMQFC